MLRALLSRQPHEVGERATQALSYGISHTRRTPSGRGSLAPEGLEEGSPQRGGHGRC